MKKTLLAVLLTACWLIACLPSVAADTATPFTYTIADGGVTITGSTTLLPGDVTLPATIEGTPVTAIGDGAFRNGVCTTMILPDTVTVIGEGAFAACRSLSAIYLPMGLTAIGKEAFADCTALTALAVPDTVTTLGDGVFARCKALTSLTLGKAVTTIGDNAFAGCNRLPSLHLPAGVTVIGKDAFSLCHALSAITVEGDNPVFCAKDGVLFDKGMTTLLVCPPARSGAYTLPDGVQRVAEGAFDRCTALTAVTLPQTLTAIEANAFYHCTALTSITFGGVTTIGEGAFASCSGLTALTFPDSLTAIGDGAFGGCPYLLTLTFGPAIATIGEGAFGDSTAIMDVFYAGVDRNSLQIGGNNTGLLTAAWHYRPRPITTTVVTSPTTAASVSSAPAEDIFAQGADGNQRQGGGWRIWLAVAVLILAGVSAFLLAWKKKDVLFHK